MGVRNYFEGILRLSYSDEEFPADLDDVWHLAYKKRSDAIRALKSYWINNFDYEILLLPKEGRGSGGHNKITYRLTTRCLEYFVARKNMVVFEVYSKVFHKALSFDPMEALNDAPTLRKLLKNYTKDNERLAIENKAMLPTLKAFERIAVADGAVCITVAAKILQVRPGYLFTILSNGSLPNGKWIYRSGGSGAWRGYQDKCNEDLLTHKVWVIDRGDGKKQIETDGVRVTPKGLTELAKMLEKDKSSEI